MEQPAQQHPMLSAPRYILDWPNWAAWAAPIKKPLDLKRLLKPADVTLPDTWVSFDHARRHLERAARLRPPAIPLSAGVGILVASPLVFVDFDDLTPDENSTTPEWASTFLRSASTIGAFIEHSGSGTGAHAFIRTTSNFPSLTRNRYTRTHAGRAVGIEIYTHKRFAALTGFPYFPNTDASPELNDPAAGDALLTALIAELGTAGAPILTPPLGPIHVPAPSDRVRAVAQKIAEHHLLAPAFEDPQATFSSWSADRATKSLDNTLSAWRFHLFTLAARECPESPQPLYELFKPHGEPAHPGIFEWQEHSGYLRKPHRVYSDIQRAHALVLEEHRLLAVALGEPAPVPRRERRTRIVNGDLVQSWAALGLAMKTTKTTSVPIAGSVNYIRVMTRHEHFKQWKLERNLLDGTTRCNREPLPDTLATRLLEPLREILDLPSDPPVQNVRDSMEVVADDFPYDPLAEYLHALPPWGDDQPALLSNWLREIGAEDSADLQLYSRRILLGLVARAFRPGVKFDYVPVFEGPTGIGKSSLVSLLVTEPYFAVLSHDLQTKDAKIALRGKWGLELAEMSAFKRSDEESRKAFFSTPSDSFRPPYGRANIDVKRRCVLFGTTEDKQYLSDWRGNRRYWPVHFPGEINLKWFAENRDRLFAEAVHHFNLGEAFHDSQEEMKSPARLASLAERLVTPAWQTRLLEHLQSLPPPSLPQGDSPGFPGIFSTQYIPNAQSVLNLPNDVQRMSDAQLARFFQRAGYHSMTLSYRHDHLSKKTYGWAHPAHLKLTSEQQKAFLSFFPALFVEGAVPAAWIDLREAHLELALRNLGISE